MFEFVVFQSVRSIITIGLGIYLALDLWRMNKAGPAFALQELRLEPMADGTLLRLHGRKTGFLGWLYTRLGVESDVRLTLTAYDLRVERQSLKGFDLFYCPTSDISSSTSGYYRAVSFAVIAASLVVSGFVQLYTALDIENDYQRQAALTITGWSGLGMVFFALLSYALFEISKRVTLTVETHGGEKSGIALRRNVIENVTVGLGDSLKAVQILNKVILDASATGVRGGLR